MSKIRECLKDSVLSLLEFCKENNIDYEFNDEWVEGEIFLFIHVTPEVVGLLDIPTINPETVDEWVDYRELLVEALNSDLTSEIAACFD